MSKLELQRRAATLSGVSYEQSQQALHLQPTIYDRMGDAGLRHLSTDFYERVFADTNAPTFRSIFASSTKSEAVENQYRFFVQIFGGPDLYSQGKGGKYVRLVGRHANYSIGASAATRWITHMQHAVDRAHARLDAETRQVLMHYFRYTAYYIVVASEYMRPDQLSGGTSVDPGRVW